MTINSVGALLLLLLISIEGFAEVSARISYRQSKRSCTVVDLKPALGPNRDQGDLGWCYANTAADLLTFEYAQELKGQKVSSTYVALANGYTVGAPADHNGGWINQALLNSQVLGLCPVSLDKKLFHRDSSMKLSTIKDLIDLKTRFDKSLGDSLPFDFDKIYANPDNPLASFNQKEIYHLLKESTVKDFPFLLARGLCQEEIQTVERRVPVRVLKTWMWPVDTAPLIFKIHQVLDNHQIIGLHYSMAMFEGDKAPISYEQTHASVIVGRRWNQKTESCELQIRNSWGDSCSAKDYKADYFRQPRVCVSGNIWVPEDKIEKYAFSVTYFDHLQGLFK